MNRVYKLSKQIHKIPKFIDVHVHTRANEPNEITLTNAIMGSTQSGVGGIMIMGNFQNYPLTNINNISRFVKQLDAASIPSDFQIKLCQVATPNNTHTLYKHTCDVAATKFYLGETTNSSELLLDRSAWRKHLAVCNTRVAVHADGDTLDEFLDDVLALDSMPHVHICHVPGRRELDAIINTRKQLAQIGMNQLLTCEVTPHHLFFNKCYFHDQQVHVCPSIRSVSDSDYLLANIQHVDCIATDKAPHCASTKNPGIECTAFVPLMLDAVYRGLLPLETVIEKCVANPQKIFGFNRTKPIYVSFEPQTLTQKPYAAPNSPYYGLTINGCLV